MEIQINLILFHGREQHTQSQTHKGASHCGQRTREQSTSNLRSRQNDTDWGYEIHPWKHRQRQRHHQKQEADCRRNPNQLSTITQAKTHCIAITDRNELKKEMVDWKVSQNTLARIKGGDTRQKP